MRRLLPFLAAVFVLAGCSGHNETPHAPAAEAPVAGSTPAPSARASAAARAVVERFGRRMQDISVLAPAPAVRAELPKAYGDTLAPELLARWQAHPDLVVGREGSSPWPDHIGIERIDCTADTCRVTGRVAYLTSNEVEHGGVFMRRAIALVVRDTAAGWRITAVHLEPARQ